MSRSIKVVFLFSGQYYNARTSRLHSNSIWLSEQPVTVLMQFVHVLSFFRLS